MPPCGVPLRVASVYPVLQIPRLQEVCEQPQEAVVVNALTQDAQ